MHPGLFTIATLAERWGVHPATIRKMVRKGDIAHFRVGNELRFNEEVIKEIEGWKKQSSSVNIEEDMSLGGMSHTKPTMACNTDAD